MAPKAKMAGRSKVGGSRAKTKKVGDTLLLDTRSSGTAQLDEKVKAQKKLEERASQVVLGYAQFDVLAHREKIVFGKWNLQPVERTQVTGLVQSFLVNGIDRFNVKHAIPLVVEKEALKAGTYTMGDEMGDELPLLEISLKLD
ncbi:hypothetical protein BU15DRAFT_63926 [Melanogaster broomeanus]|nr:hypothetical protein BU15DRAFT_63926 [Melanogaster broomeanus]